MMQSYRLLSHANAAGITLFFYGIVFPGTFPLSIYTQKIL